MTIDKIVDDIAAYLKQPQYLSELVSSEMLGGRLNLEEMARRTTGLPAARVTWTGSRDGRMVANKFRTRGLFCIVLVVQSGPEGKPTPQDRAHGIARLASRALIVVASAKTWGNAEVEGPPEKVASSNPYTTTIDKVGFALWGITWEQMLSLTAVPVPPPLDSFKKLDADHQIVPSNPEIDAEDTLILPGG